MAILFANNASGLTTGTFSSGATTVSLESGGGLNFPQPTGSDYFMLTLEDSTGVIEICKCTGRDGDSFTVTRAQEGTASPSQFAPGTRAELRVTSGTLAAFLQIAGGTSLSADFNLGGFAVTNGTINENVTVSPGAETNWHSGNFTPGSYSGVNHTHTGIYATSSHTHDTADVATGTLADALVAESNVTQHKGVLSRITSSTQTGATYTLVTGDVNTKVRYTGAAASEFTFPSLGAVGDVIFITNASAYNLTITPSGITFNTKDDVATVVCSVKHGVMGFHCVATDVWEVTGAYD